MSPPPNRRRDRFLAANGLIVYATYFGGPLSWFVFSKQWKEGTAVANFGITLISRLGHDAVGVIHELGEFAAASGLFKVGQRVAVSAITVLCVRRLPAWLPKPVRRMLGGWRFANVKDGSFAEYFHVNNAVANLAPIPDGLTDEQAAYCCDMLSTGFVAAEFANIPIGGSVAVSRKGLWV